MKQLRGIDLFSGAGGSSWGARAAGVALQAAFDKWDLAADVYQNNFPGTKFFKGALEESDPCLLAKEIGEVDLILASPECTGHSPAKGKTRGSVQSRETAFQVVRFAKAFKPRWIVIENVVSMRRWNRYKVFINRLQALGYHTREQVLDSSEFDVPQRRCRLFITCDSQQVPPIISKGLKTVRSAAEIVIANEFKAKPLRIKNRAKATLQRAKRAMQAIGTMKPFLLVYYGSDRAGGWQGLDRPLRTITTVDRFALVIPESNGHSMRMLQVPELAAAMGFSTEMRLEHGTRRERIHLIGNAVCPPVMQSVIAQLTGAPSKPDGGRH